MLGTLQINIINLTPPSPTCICDCQLMNEAKTGGVLRIVMLNRLLFYFIYLFCHVDNEDGNMTTSVQNMFTLYNLGVILLILWGRIEAPLSSRAQYITFRSGPLLYIRCTSTIMVSVWLGSSRAVIFSL